jgi:glutathione synthase/RimK-type ligase-like ATP-grasp enzyme
MSNNSDQPSPNLPSQNASQPEIQSQPNVSDEKENTNQKKMDLDTISFKTHPSPKDFLKSLKKKEPKKIKRSELEKHPFFKYIPEEVFKKMIKTNDSQEDEISEEDITYNTEDLPIQVGDYVECTDFDDLNKNQIEFLNQKPYHKVKSVVNSKGSYYLNGEPHIELGYRIPFRMKRFVKVDRYVNSKYKVLFLQFDLPIDLHGEKDEGDFFKGQSNFSNLFDILFRESLPDCFVDFSQYDDIYKMGNDFYIYDTKIKDFDFVFFGFMSNFTTIVKMLIGYLEVNNIPYLKYGTFKDLDNKAYEMHLIQSLGYPYIPSIMTTKITGKIVQKVKEFGFPVILKDVNLNRGEGVWKCDNMQELIKQIGNWQQHLMLIQKFVPNDGDYRVISIKNKVELVIKKERIPGTTEFRANVARGGRAVKGSLPVEIIEMCEDISKHLVCDIVGFDIIQNKDNGEYYVMETNSSPHFPTFSVISGINIPQIIVDYIIKKIIN